MSIIGVKASGHGCESHPRHDRREPSIGRDAAIELLRLDPEMHLVVVGRGEAGPRLATDLVAGGHEVSAVAADLTSVDCVGAACAEIVTMLDRGTLPPLSGFIGNAGVQYTDHLQISTDGLEATFAVNVLANHVFLRSFASQFAASANVTITVSDTHFGDLKHNLGMVPGPAWQDPEKLAHISAFPKPRTTRAGRTAYSTSKLAAIYLVHEWARRLPLQVDIVSFNPGFVPGTGLARNACPATRFMMRRALPALARTPIATTQPAAGQNLARAALRTVSAPTGAYIDRNAVTRSSDESYAPDREAALWNTCEQLLNRNRKGHRTEKDTHPGA